MPNELYHQEIARHVLALREALVRHDENLKAHTLMEQCVPYFLLNDKVIEQAWMDQAAMTAHMRNPDLYADYYQNNPHELPFEEMFGGSVEELVDRGKLFRVSWLIEELLTIKAKYVLDVACNDGAIAHYIAEKADTEVSGLDLNPTCVERALERGVKARVGTIEDNATPYDAVYAMEVIEHVPDPARFLAQIAQHTHHIFISTPHGATAGGDVAEWATVEYKGHVRAVLPQDLVSWGKDAELYPNYIGLTPNNILVAHYTRP